jgi:hypothetical protein
VKLRQTAGPSDADGYRDPLSSTSIIWFDPAVATPQNARSLDTSARGHGQSITKLTSPDCALHAVLLCRLGQLREYWAYMDGSGHALRALPKPDMPLVVNIDGGYVHSSARRHHDATDGSKPCAEP